MTPPRLARALVRLASGRDDADIVLHDLERHYLRISEASGPSAARRWYWSQALRGLAWRMRPDVDLLRRRLWDGAAGDLRTGSRALLRRPAYAIGVVGTLGLGLGSTAMVLAVAWRVWLAPMPFPDPERVVRLYETEPLEMGGAAAEDEAPRRWRISPPLLEDMRSNEWGSIEAVAGVSSASLDWLDGGQTRRVTALQVSPEAFGILGIFPSLGQLPESDQKTQLLLTRGFWERSFGANASVIGAPLSLDGISYVITGVVELPAGYPRPADMVLPLAFTEDQLTEGMRGARYLDVIGRVRPGHLVSEATAEARAFVHALGDDHPQHEGWGADVVPLGENLIAPYRGVLALLLAGGLIFLALAAANVSGLVAARRTEARDDRAVRLALGASEGRLLRGALAESALLGVAGAGGALVLARWLIAPLRALVPRDVPRISEVSIDPWLATSVVGAGLLVGVAVGLLGYATSRGGSYAPSNRRGSTTPGLRGRQYLVAGQVALTTLLTTGGIAILRHVSTLRSVDVGFQPEDVLASPSILSEARYPTDEGRLRVWEELEEGLRARGLSAAVGVNTPMSGSNMPFGFRIDPASEQAFAQYHSVSDAYFETLGIRIVAGRTFGVDDHDASVPVVVVNEAFDREYFPGESAVGRDVLLLQRSVTVIGVVASTSHFGPDTEPPPEIYAPLSHDPWTLGTVLIRSERSDIAPLLGDVVNAIDPALDVPEPEPYTRLVDEWFAPLRLQLVLIGGLALLGLSLASTGLYALVAYHVSARRRDIGIRIALGAPQEKVFGAVVAQGSLLALIGGAFGLSAWYAFAPGVGRLLDGIDLSDPSVPVLVALVVGTTSVLATLVPAWRSASVDPARTLKAE